jgi:diguanylate cyclase (GGDEF)-like protein
LQEYGIFNNAGTVIATQTPARKSSEANMNDGDDDIDVTVRGGAAMASVDAVPTSGEITNAVAPRAVPQVSLDACLVQIYPLGPGIGRRIPLANDIVLIGRDADCNLCLVDPSVSRKHAEIRPVSTGFFLIDCRSTNGTHVNDHPVSSSRLKDGDTIRIGTWIFRFLTGENVESLYHEEIHRLTIIDGLTGAYNKRYLLDALSSELSRASRHHRPLALILIDVDHFKQLNDTHGHLAGDDALRELTSCLREAVRREDVVARYGGEEFVMVLPETTRDGAVQLAERLRQAIAEHTFHSREIEFRMTVSIGVAAIEAAEVLTSEEFIARADARMYQAKKAGRDRVCAGGEEIILPD